MNIEFFTSLIGGTALLATKKKEEAKLREAYEKKLREEAAAPLTLGELSNYIVAPSLLSSARFSFNYIELA